MEELLLTSKSLEKTPEVLAQEVQEILAELLNRVFGNHQNSCGLLEGKTQTILELFKRSGLVFRSIFDRRVLYNMNYPWPFQFTPLRTRATLIKKQAPNPHYKIPQYCARWHGNFLLVESYVLYFLQFASFPFHHNFSSKPKRSNNSSYRSSYSGTPWGKSQLSKNSFSTYKQLFQNYLTYFLPLRADQKGSVDNLLVYKLHFVDAFADQWLNRQFEEIPVKNRSAHLECVDLFITRLLARQHEHLAGNSEEVFCPELSIVLPSLFQFFRNSFIHWPLDELPLAQRLIKIWIKFVTPWKANTSKGQIKSTQKEKKLELQLEKLKLWSGFLDNTLPFYTVLLAHMLRLSVNFDFGSSVFVKLLNSILSIYSGAVVKELQYRENLLLERNNTYTLRGQRMVNSIQSITERDLSSYVNECLTFINQSSSQEVQVSAQEVAEEYERYQRSNRKPKSSPSVSFFPFSKAKESKPVKKLDLNEHEIIRNLNRLFGISVGKDDQTGAQSMMDSVNPTTGKLTNESVEKILEGKLICPPPTEVEFATYKSENVWEIPAYSYELPSLIEFARRIDANLQTKWFLKTDPDWKQHRMYGMSRKIASMVFLLWSSIFLSILFHFFPKATMVIFTSIILITVYVRYWL